MKWVTRSGWTLVGIGALLVLSTISAWGFVPLVIGGNILFFGSAARTLAEIRANREQQKQSDD